MAGRTFAIGDIHGDADALYKLLACFPELTTSDTIVFVGDYLDRGPKSKEVVAFIRDLPGQTPAKVVALRGNHEDAWLRVIERGWPEFTLPITNGCLATLRSFLGRPVPEDGEPMSSDELPAILKGSFFPPGVVAWMRGLPYFYEDAHAIYVHAGLPHGESGFPHPSQVKTPAVLLWCRDDHFFRRYTGKLVVFGHTATELLPPELSSYTPEDPSDIWAGPCTIGLDTGCGKGGFLTGLELPSLRVYESR
jgi:serine/threonine protein phosphatase 1